MDPVDDTEAAELDVPAIETTHPDDEDNHGEVVKLPGTEQPRSGEKAADPSTEHSIAKIVHKADEKQAGDYTVSAHAGGSLDNGTSVIAYKKATQSVEKGSAEAHDNNHVVGERPP